MKNYEHMLATTPVVHQPTGKEIRLSVYWNGEHLLVTVVEEDKPDDSHYHTKLYPVDHLGAEKPGRPAIKGFEIGADGIGCAIIGQNQDRTPFWVEATDADFVSGTGMNFVRRR